MKRAICNVGDRIEARILGGCVQGVVDSINGDQLMVLVDGYDALMWVHVYEVVRVIVPATQLATQAVQS
jgi:hypothetical protein